MLKTLRIINFNFTNYSSLRQRRNGSKIILARMLSVLTPLNRLPSFSGVRRLEAQTRARSSSPCLRMWLEEWSRGSLISSKTIWIMEAPRRRKIKLELLLQIDLKNPLPKRRRNCLRPTSLRSFKVSSVNSSTGVWPTQDSDGLANGATNTSTPGRGTNVATLIPAQPPISENPPWSNTRECIQKSLRNLPSN